MRHSTKKRKSSERAAAWEQPTTGGADAGLASVGEAGRVLEVKASFMGEVHKVHHLSKVRAGQASRVTKALLALGALLLLTAMFTFGTEILRVERQKRHQKEVASFLKTRGLPEKFVPKVQGSAAMGGLSLVSALVGLTFLILGAARYRNERESPDFTLGSDPRVDVPLDQAWLPRGRYRFPVIQWSKTGHRLLFTPQMRGSVLFSHYSSGAHSEAAGRLEAKPQIREETCSLQELVESGRARPAGGILGAYELPLDGVSRGSVVMGDNEVEFALVPARAPFTAKRQSDSSARLFYAASFAGHALLLFMLFALPAESVTMESDSLNPNNRYRKLAAERIKNASHERKQAERKEKKEKEPTRVAKAKTRSSKHPSGPRDKRFESSESSGSSPGQSPSRSINNARNAGITGVLGRLSGRALASVFSRDSAISAEAENSLGHLVGHNPGPYGLAGLAPGTGRSGNPAGLGGVSLGTWGPGMGQNGGTNGVFDGHRPSGYKVPKHKSQGPAVQPGPVRVNGVMTPAMIRRTIRRHVAEVRYCYVAHGLSKNKNLQGQVKVRFVIGRKGRVTTVGIVHTSLSSPLTESCIRRAIRRWRFPKPPSSIVVVTYPFNFRPRS